MTPNWTINPEWLALEGKPYLVPAICHPDAYKPIRPRAKIPRCHCGYCRGKRTMVLHTGVGWRCRATNCLMISMNDLNTPDKMNLKLLGKRLLVQELPTERTTHGGIHLPDYALADRPRLFRVLAVGSKPVEPKVGQRVLCYSHLTGPYKLDDGTFIITEDQVLAIL